MSFDQKFGKPDLTQMWHEQNGCEKLYWPFFETNKDSTQKAGIYQQNLISKNQMFSFCAEEKGIA